MLALAFVLAAAATGYVDDAVCGECHKDRAATFQHVGMAKSFSRPRRVGAIEDFTALPFFHERSQQFFEMEWRGDQLVFRRYQRTPDGTPIHVFEQPVAWILGSGHHARTYLYRTPGGELYQLPLAWYTATHAWGMAPGYDRKDHDGVTRRVRHECLFCHNAYARSAPDPLTYWRSQDVPADLPEGIGCQRCHGPGQKHAEAALLDDREATRTSILNPARLDARHRNDICYECHMQPAVALFGPRKFGRDIYSFRPGEKLSDYAVALDADEKALPRGDRFEINHHAYRLEQSRCFRESAGKLGCLTCHDPHRKVSEADRAAHYRAACLSCHANAHNATRDCTTCHMQKRRTQDVVQVVMTDHFIRRIPGGPELVAPLEEREPHVDGVRFLDAESAPRGPIGDIYRLVAWIRATGGTRASMVEQLEKLLAEVKPPEIEPYLDLAMGELRQRRYAELEKTVTHVLERSPGQPLALEWLGMAKAGQSGDRGEAIPLLREAAAKGRRPETEFNLGVFLAGVGKTEEAIEHYERAVAMRPNLVAAWLRLADARRECGFVEAADEAQRRALEISP